MPKQPKIALDISQPEVRKMLQSLFLWVEHDFTPMHTRDLEMASFKHLKSIGDDIASKFFCKSKKVKLSYHESAALFELIEIYPQTLNYVARTIYSTIHPHLEAYTNKNPQLLAGS